LFLGVRGVKVARVGGSVEMGLARWLEGRMMEDGEGEEEEKQVCRCGGVVRCGECKGRVQVGEDLRMGKEWFGERNAWQFGNR